MRGLLLGLLPLLLGGCFNSETPRIPQAALSQPGDFSGQFWQLTQIENSQARIVSIRHGDDGSISFSGKEPVLARMVDLLGARTYLLISDEDDNRSTYYMLRRRDDGIWEYDDIAIARDSPFERQNLDYMRGIAQRHGLSLDEDVTNTEILGDVRGMAIPALFRDPQFIAALDIHPLGFYLPMREQPASLSEIELPGQEQVGNFLGLASGPDIARGGVCVEGLAGTFLDRASLIASLSRVQIREEADCHYSMTVEMTGFASTLTILPLDGEREYYLALEQWDDGNGRWTGYVWLVQKDLSSWTFSQIALRPSAGDPAIDLLRKRYMGEAAARYDVRPTESGLAVDSGRPLDADRIADLLRDGQFTTGLSVMSAPGRWLVSRSAIFESAP